MNDALGANAFREAVEAEVGNVLLRVVLAGSFCSGIPKLLLKLVLRLGSRQGKAGRLSLLLCFGGEGVRIARHFINMNRGEKKLFC